MPKKSNMSSIKKFFIVMLSIIISGLFFLSLNDLLTQKLDSLTIFIISGIILIVIGTFGILSKKQLLRILGF